MTLPLTGTGSSGSSVVTKILDQFTDADTTTLSSHTISPTNTPATAWVIDGDTWQVISNKAKHVTGTGQWQNVHCDPGQTDCTVIADITPSGHACGICTRYSDSSNWWHSNFNTGLCYLVEHNAAVFTNRASSNPGVVDGTTYELRLITNGTSFEAKVNGASQWTYTSSFNQSATQSGLVGYWPNDTGSTFDNFTVNVP